VTVRRTTLVRIAVAAFVAVAIVFFVLALVAAWRESSELPSVWRLCAVGALWVIGVLSAAYAWAALLGGDHRLEHGAAAIVSQIAKYIPGGVWQASGQLGLARSAGVQLQRSAVAFTVQALMQAVAACTFGAIVAVTWSSGAGWLRALIGLASVLSLVLVDRRWMVWILHKIPRTRDASGDLVPPQRTILLTYGSSVVTIATLGIGYLIVLGSFGAVDDPWLVVGAFALAWLVGFLLVPLPSGLGAREAVLVAILHGTFPSSVLVAASVYQRVALIATEGLLALVASHRVRPSRLRTTAGDAARHGRDPLS
jgi:glycosyltransferase 2 family protein